MQCQICRQATATVHITQVVETEVTRIDLCEACASDRGINDPTGFPMAQILAELRKPATDRPERAGGGNPPKTR